MPLSRTEDGVALYYEMEGDSAKPLLLFSNSLGTNLGMWEEQRAFFADRYRLLFYDSRGHGRSEAPAGPYSMDRLAKDALSLLDSLEIEKCFFCGLSMGGMVGMRLGTTAPERLRKIVLCSTSAFMPPAQNWTDRAKKARAGGMDEIVERVIERWFTAPFRESEPKAVHRPREQFLSTPGEGYAASCEAIREMDQRETIRKIAAPTLVLTGGKDPATPPTEGLFLAHRIPKAHYVEIPDAAHLANIEQAGAFNAALENFLED